MFTCFGIAIPAAVVILTNGAAFLLYGLDKRKAQTGAWRIPERVLLGSALLGPFGAWAGMNFFRHKTKRWKFLLVPVFMALQVIAALWIFFFTGGL